MAQRDNALAVHVELVLHDGCACIDVQQHVEGVVRQVLPSGLPLLNNPQQLRADVVVLLTSKKLIDRRLRHLH